MNEPVDWNGFATSELINEINNARIGYSELSKKSQRQRAIIAKLEKSRASLRSENKRLREAFNFAFRILEGGNYIDESVAVTEFLKEYVDSDWREAR